MPPPCCQGSWGQTEASPCCGSSWGCCLGGWAGMGFQRLSPCPQPSLCLSFLISGPSQHPCLTGHALHHVLSSPYPRPWLSSLLVAYLKDRRLSGGAGSLWPIPWCMPPTPVYPAPSSVQCCSQASSCYGLELCVLLVSKAHRSSAFPQILGHMLHASAHFRAVNGLGYRAVLLLGCHRLCGSQSSGSWNQNLSEVKPKLDGWPVKFRKVVCP